MLQTNKFQLLYWLDSISRLPLAIIILILGCGLLFLVYGKMIFNIAVVINAAMFGAYFGWTLGIATGRPYLFAIAFGLLFGILAWPMLHIAVAFVAGMIGMTLFLQIVFVWPKLTEISPILAAIGFILFAILGWKLLIPAVILFTSLEGATMTTLATLALINQLASGNINIRWFVFGKSGIIALIIFALTAIGIIYQMKLDNSRSLSYLNSVSAVSSEKTES